MKGRGFQRAKPTLPIGRRVLIACEGSQTEPGYFQEIIRERRLTAVQVRILQHTGTDPRGIVQAVAQVMKQEQKSASWLPEDQAWAVFDGDEHMAANPDNWNDALQMARDRKIRLAISNPSFELWYLLHFRDQFAYLTRQEALRGLREHLPRYEKSQRLYTAQLAPRTPDALSRAHRLAELATARAVTVHDNPGCAGVADLVESLLNLEPASRRR